MSEPIYFNAPIELLAGFMVDPKKCLDDFLDYALYNHALGLEFGNIKIRFNDAAKYFHVRLGNVENSFKNGEILNDSIPENSPKVGIKIELFWDFFSHEKSDFEKACFLTFTALKSILGSKPYVKCTNGYLLARMDGKRQTIKSVDELSDEIRVFSNRYQLTRIKNELQDNWGITYYSYYNRGFYFSTELDLNALTFQAEKRRKSFKDMKRKEAKETARKLALQKLDQ